MTSNDAGAEFDVTVSVPERKLSVPHRIRSVEYAKAVVSVENRDGIRAGSGSHAVTIDVVDRAGTRISDFSGVAAVDFPRLSGTLSSNFVQIKNGVSDPIVFSPGTLAGQNLAIQVKIPGVRDVEGNVVNVRPGDPMLVTLSAEKDGMEALKGTAQTLTAKLFDRFGNVADSTGYSAKFSVPDEYASHLSLEGG